VVFARQSSSTTGAVHEKSKDSEALQFVVIDCEIIKNHRKSAEGFAKKSSVQKGH